jgi:nitrogen-specific signal transduction histidine kinase/ActR/RegA family two-component response regulator
VFTAPVRGADGEIMGRLWSCEDISERRQLERSLLQAQKMEAVGRLAGGIAHDFNNLLTGIAGNLAVLKLNQAHPIKEHLQLVDSAEAAARRAAELVKQMLGFSRQNTLRLQSTDVNAVVKELVQLLRHSFEKTIELHQDLASDLWSVKADATHIEQVLMNICVNARDAMSGRTGTITIGTENLDSVADRDSKPYVVITIADSGSGMPEEIRNKIFEPFFTTKEAGKGTGLGLSMSYGIIEQHHGWIECASQEGDGTTFRIYLPKGATQSPRKPRTVISPTKGLKGSEQILVVDDEAVVRAVAQGVLRHNGYRVLTAGDGKEALDTIAQRRSEIDLVLLDLTMPRMTGKEAFRRIKESHPDLPVIICSGYLVDLDGFSEEAGAIPEGFVQKPYEMHQLLTSIRQTLGPGVELQDADTESTLTTDEAA